MCGGFHVVERIEEIEATGGDFVASSLIRVEVRVKPIRSNDLDLLQRYDALLVTHPLTVVAIDDGVIERPTLLREKYRLKTPDAIHLATAIERGADAFLTGDGGSVAAVSYLSRWSADRETWGEVRVDSDSMTTTSLDAEGRLTTNVPCVRCGYNLRLLQHDASCPECGSPVSESLQPGRLASSTPAFLRWTRVGLLMAALGRLLLLPLPWWPPIVCGCAGLVAAGSMSMALHRRHASGRLEMQTLCGFLGLCLLTITVIAIWLWPAGGSTFSASMVALALLLCAHSIVLPIYIRQMADAIPSPRLRQGARVTLIVLILGVPAALIGGVVLVRELIMQAYAHAHPPYSPPPPPTIWIRFAMACAVLLASMPIVSSALLAAAAARLVHAQRR